ncbi:MAG: ABC transporter permease [Acidobacteria bacterium]|nr:ABC transporter permease [Acidobacteriota bacterium]
MKAWWIAVNEWKQLLREREAIFWIFIGPVLFVVFFGILMRPAPARPPEVAIWNQDETDEAAGGLEALLREDGVTVRRVEEPVSKGRTLVVPAGAGAALRAGDPVTLTLRTGTEETAGERNLQFGIRKALTRLFLAGIPPGAGTGEGGSGPAGGGENEDLIRVVRHEIDVEHREMTAGFQRSVPAYMVMFVFMNLLIGGSTIAEDRASGRLRRIALAPVRSRDILLGKLLSRFAVGWIQIVYLLLIGTLVFRIQWAQRNWVFLLFMSLFALASASLGILLGTLVRDPDKAISIAIWSAVILSPLGGLWWPLEIVGPAMRKIAWFVPTGWGMEGVNAMLAFGAGPRELAPFLLCFTGLFLASIFLAARRLKP